jgi:CRP/FNR family cyclic AMP-dependent transcriptional regulator
MTPIGDLHDFFGALPGDVQAAIRAASSPRSLPADSRLLHAGRVPNAVYRIVDGRVKYSAWDSRGRETVLIHMSAGDWVGLAEVFSELPASWNVVAQTPLTVQAITRTEFDRLVGQHPTLARALLKLFARRFSLHRLFGLDHSELGLKERLIKMLYLLSFSHDKQAGDDAPIAMRLSQEELGKVVGASRQKLNPALKELAAEGLLEVGFGGLILNSRAAILARYGHLFGVEHLATR